MILSYTITFYIKVIDMDYLQILYYKNNVGVERTKVKRVEMESLVLEVIDNQKNQILSKKHEACTL